MSCSNYQRWQKAQYAEKKFWEREYWGRDTPNSNRDLVRELWSMMLSNGFGIDFSFFANKDVLEVGCGPSGIIFSISEAKTRSGLDPMELSEILVQEPSKLAIVRQGVAENIPHHDESFDVVICFNVLDHCYEPSLVIEQCQRVLRKDGSLLLWVHALRNNYRLFQSLLNKLDPPHPNHFTVDQIIQISSKFLLLDRVKRLKGARENFGEEPAEGSLKIALANYLTENVWLRYKKVNL
jgi:SAM-dependent methyltransferase